MVGKTRKPPSRWDEDTIRVIAVDIVETIGKYPGTTLLAAAQMAQERFLPAEKRKRLSTVANLPPELQWSLDGTPAENLTILSKEWQAFLGRVRNADDAPLPILIPAKVDTQDFLRNRLTMEDLLGEVGRRLGASLGIAPVLEKAAHVATALATPPQPRTVAVEHTGKIRIGITGLQGRQFQDVLTDCQFQDVELVDVKHKITAGLDGLVVTKWGSHGGPTGWDKAKAEMPAGCLKFASGGITTVVKEVYDLRALLLTRR